MRHGGDRAGDPVIEDARRREAQAQAQLEEARAQRKRVEERRREAADLLAVSREAEARNHFAEAITKSMRRRP